MILDKRSLLTRMFWHFLTLTSGTNSFLTVCLELAERDQGVDEFIKDNPRVFNSVPAVSFIWIDSKETRTLSYFVLANKKSFSWIFWVHGAFTVLHLTFCLKRSSYVSKKLTWIEFCFGLLILGSIINPGFMAEFIILAGWLSNLSVWSLLFFKSTISCMVYLKS